ncbi:MAG: phosphatase PAP2 family protein, partial [Actinomycetia bacterium]|nr:phosphatase PAP2 family protein [Actinomycetes bacterium]
GKGSSLDVLVSLGAVVPETSVVTTAAYRLFTADPGLAALLDELRTAEVPAPEDHEREQQRVDDAFLAVDLPSPILEAMALVGPPVGDGATVAVRSSATAEDTATASFAGQYRSYLNVGPEELSRAVRLVWSSLWHPAPRSYRRFRSIPEDDLSMAVVLMAMLDPSHAGVIFTADPGGAADQLRIEVVEGLGEALVSGEATPEAFVVPREGSVEQLAAVRPVFGDLVAEALRVEDELGKPQDIEWAVDRGTLFLVQARPITTEAADVGTDDGFDVRPDPSATYTTAGIGESLPGVVPPLDWTVNSWVLENAFRRLFNRLGGCPDGLAGPHALIGRFRGRAALNLDMMLRAAGSIPGASPEELEHQYFGEAVRGDDAEPAPTPPKAGAAQSLRTLKARQAAAQESEVVSLAVDGLLDLEMDLRLREDEDLLAGRARLLHLATRVVTAEVAIAAMATASYRSIEVFLCKQFGDADAASAAQLMTSGSGGSRRALIALAMGELAEESQTSPELREATSFDDWNEAEQALAKLPSGRAFVKKYRSALHRAGSTSYFGGPTWAEVPDLAWLTFRQEVTSPPNDDDADRKAARDEIEKRLMSGSDWSYTRWNSGQLFDIRRRFFRREAADAAEFLDRREHTKAAMLKLGGSLRRINLEFGKRLLDAGRLEDVDDVRLLSNAELVDTVRGGGPTLDTIAARRRRLDEADLDGPLPRVFEGAPESASSAKVEGERVEGWGASPGRYEGPARVVRSVTASSLARGDVLVAQATDASWAPLFLLAGAIVVEDGGPLSHAAIVARELGMPAVVNVPGIIARLESEPEAVALRVDGTTGEVIIHGKAGAEAVVDLGNDAQAGEPDPRQSAGVAPLRQPVEPDIDLNRLNVFVTGLIGAGALFSTAIALTESMSSRRGRNRLYRRAAPIAASLSLATVHGFDDERVRPVGIRPRSNYVVGTVLLAVMSIALTVVSTGAYVADESGNETNVAFWALSLSGAATLGMLAIYVGNAAVGWPNVLPTVRQLLPARPKVEGSWAAAISRGGKVTVALMLAVLAVLAILATLAEGVLLEVDESLYRDWDLRQNRDRIGPDFLIWLGRPILIIPLAIAIGLGTIRCRVIALAFPLAVVAAGVSNVLLGWIVRRGRPPLSTHAGEVTSFPGGHFMQMTLLFGVIPLVAYIVTRRRWVQVITAILSAALLVLVNTDTFITGGHWPSDQLAGLLIGLSLVVVIWGLAQNGLHHDSCGDCPSQL